VKPPYRVPSMKEITETPWNGFCAVSTFSGAGGSCTGYRMAGFRVLYANEFIGEAQRTYRKNHPSSVLDPRDIRKVGAEDILRATGKRAGEIDLFDGSPPCSSFSTAGRREKLWGQEKRYSDTTQRTDDLFFEYIRLVRDLQPRTFIAENVSGLVKGTAKGYFKQIIRLMKECGYRVEAQVLDAQWLGVPQTRERVIFVGVRNDLNRAPKFPTPLPYRYDLRDALEGVPDGHKRFVKDGLLTKWMYEHTPAGKSFQWASEHHLNKPGAWHSHVRLSWDKPSYTVLQSKAQSYHPDECRPLTIPEVKRVCSFPDDYVLTGNWSQQWERCGRSVPPVMMFHIAKAVGSILETL